eukprot:9407563-Alexandrium_andersonii.AAC.1
MSASLVGSEMCIRDRCKLWCCRASTSSKRLARRKMAPKWSGPYGSHIGSVSYTHLTLPTICSV